MIARRWYQEFISTMIGNILQPTVLLNRRTRVWFTAIGKFLSPLNGEIYDALQKHCMDGLASRRFSYARACGVRRSPTLLPQSLQNEIQQDRRELRDSRQELKS